jgi:hypothetical protein
VVNDSAVVGAVYPSAEIRGRAHDLCAQGGEKGSAW